MGAATVARPAGAAALSAAMMARDFDAIRELLADDVVVRSPITSRFAFEGRNEVLELLVAVRETFEELSYVHGGNEGERSVLLFRAAVGGQELEGCDVLRLDGDGRIAEITVFVRPLPGIAALAAGLAPRLARRRSRARAVLTRVLVAPLLLFNRIGDAIGVWLVRPGA